MRKFKRLLRGSSVSLLVLVFVLKGMAAGAAQTNIGSTSADCGNIGLNNTSFDRVAKSLKRSCGVYKIDSTNIGFSSLSDAALVLEYFTSEVDDGGAPSDFNQVPDTAGLFATENIPGLQTGGTLDDISDNVIVSHTLSGNVILDFNQESVFWQSARVVSSTSHNICYGNSGGPDAFGTSGGWSSYGRQSMPVLATNVSPIVSSVSVTVAAASADISLTTDIAGTAYWIVVPTGSTAPSPAEIKAGVDYSGVALAGAGSNAISSGSNTFAANYAADPGSGLVFHVAGEASGSYLGCPSLAGFAAPAAPEAPTGLAAVGGDTQAEISFTPGADNGSAISNYLYSIDGSDYTALSPTDASSPITIAGLINGTTYSVTLKAVNAGGESTASAPVSATPSADSDGDGIPDIHDAFPNDPVEDTDTDGDGVGDKGDAGGSGIGIRVVNAPLGCDFQGSVQNTAQFLDSAPGSPLDKQLEFVLTGCGNEVTIEALFGTDLPPGSVAYKISATGVWTEILGAVISGNKITYTVTDNGPLDDDSILGQITDPVTAVVPASAGPAIPVPALPLFGLVLLGGLLGIFGLRKLRC